MNIINEDYLVESIIGQSRHQFIYGNDEIVRTRIIEKLVQTNPIISDENIPVAIHIKDLFLPTTPEKKNNDIKSKHLNEEFFTYSVIYDIIQELKKQDIDKQRMTRLFDIISRFFINKKDLKINSIDDLITITSESKDYYKEAYNYYLNTGNDLISKDVLLSYFKLDLFINELKSLLNNNSYIGLIFDNKDDITKETKKIINSLVGRRINKDISVKVMTAPEKWDTYLTLSNNIIEEIHDYGVVELDESYKKYTKSLKNERKC